MSYIHNVTSDKTFDIPFHETQARLVAGAVAWSGFVSMLTGSETFDRRDYHFYPPNSYWSPSYQLRTKDVVGDDFSNNPNNYQQQPGIEALIQQFSMFALAAYDDDGNLTNVTSPLMPIASVQLKINWKHAIPILVLIPALQFVVLVFVVLWANNAVIRSDSMLSTTGLLMPLLDHLKHERGHSGSILSGEEIARTHPETDAKFFYGYERYLGRRYSAEIFKETDKGRTEGHQIFSRCRFPLSPCTCLSSWRHQSTVSVCPPGLEVEERCRESFNDIRSSGQQQQEMHLFAHPTAHVLFGIGIGIDTGHWTR